MGRSLQLSNGDIATATTLNGGWTYVDLSAPSGGDPVAYALSVVDDYATDESNPDLFATPMFGTLELRRYSGPEIHVSFGFDVPRATVDAVRWSPWSPR